MEFLTRIVLLVVESVRGAVGEKVLVTSGGTGDGTQDLDAVCGLDEGMIILVGRTVDVHLVDVLDLERVSGLERSTLCGIEHILTQRVLDIVGVVTGVVGVLNRVAVAILGDFDGHRELGEVLSVLGDDDAVHDGYGDGVFVRFVFVKCCEGHAVRPVFVDQQVNAILGLFTDFQFNLAGGAGIGVGLVLVVKVERDRLEYTGREGGIFRQRP